jgi:uncharacterized protein (DUF433 family)
MKAQGRITVDPYKMGGVPCIRNLRMPVATVLAMLADGKSNLQIIKEHPELEIEDIHDALKYASEILRTRELPLAI